MISAIPKNCHSDEPAYMYQAGEEESQLFKGYGKFRVLGFLRFRLIHDDESVGMTNSL